MKKPQLVPISQGYQESVEKLCAKETKTVSENELSVVELVPLDKALFKGHAIIKPEKMISNDIQRVDEQI